MNILWSRNFILLVIFMATRQEKTTNYKQIFWLALLVFLIVLAWWAYLKISSTFIGYDIERVQKQIAKKDAELKSFSDKPGYDKLQYIQDMENNNHMMPRSDHISAIMEIF